jgi:hypothetical protein
LERSDVSNPHQSEAVPLPLLDEALVQRLKHEAAPAVDAKPARGKPDHEPATWFRLVTALSSCYVYVLVHTAPEPCRFEVEADGRARCLLSNEVQWELALPPAAYRQFRLVVELWRAGELSHCLQSDSVRLGEPLELPSGALAVAIPPALPPKRRTQTLARR